MYWLRRPPYLRYFAGALIVLAAAWIELRGSPEVLHPFAAEPLEAGVDVSGVHLDWRRVPEGMLPPVQPDGVTVRFVPSGVPLLPGDLTDVTPQVPDGWWAVEVPLPDRAWAGQDVQLVVIPGFTSQGGQAVPGRVLEAAAGDDEFGIERPSGLVAVPPEDAALVAMAAADGRVAVLLAP